MPKPQAVAAPASAEPSATDTDAAIRQKIANLQKITRSSVPIFLVGAFGGSFILTLIFALMPGGLYDSSINMHLECRELNTKIMSLGGNPEPCILVDPLPGTVFIGIVMFVLIFFSILLGKAECEERTHTSPGAINAIRIVIPYTHLHARKVNLRCPVSTGRFLHLLGSLLLLMACASPRPSKPPACIPRG